MRIRKEKIVDGFITYVESEVIPKIGDDRAMQIILSTAVNMLKANKSIADKVIKNDFVRAIASYENNGGVETYELDGLFSAVEESVKKHTYFPVMIPAIPFISPTQKELKFSAEDIEMLKTYIEGA